MSFTVTEADFEKVYGKSRIPPAITPQNTSFFKVTEDDFNKVYGKTQNKIQNKIQNISQPLSALTQTAGETSSAVSYADKLKEKQTAQKYGLIDGKVKLPSSVENQGLYFAPDTQKTKLSYLIDSSAKGLAGGILQTGEAVWQDLPGDAGKAERAYYDYVMESAYNPQKAGRLAEYRQQMQNARQNEKLNTDTLGYKLLESSDADMAKATEGMGATGQFLTGVVGSTLQNTYLAPVALINPALAAGLMSLSAAGRTTKEQADKGKNLDKALARGAIDGSIEYFTGKIGMDAIADLLAGQGDNIVKNVLRSVYSEAGEEGMSYLAGYVADKLSKEPDAKFSIQELALNMLAGGLSGGLLGGGGAAVGQIGRNISGITNVPQIEFDVEYSDFDSDAQYYKPVTFDTNNVVETNYYGRKITSTKVRDYNNNIFVSNQVKIKRKQLNYTNTRINKAAQMIHAKSTYEMPRIIICDTTEIKNNVAAAYIAKDNTLCINVAVTNKNGVLNLPKTVACAENHNNVFIHEMLHWYDAQRYKESHGTIEGYIDSIRKESKRHIEKLVENGYNIDEISEYAYRSYLDGNLDETWTEYRVKQILGDK